MTPHAIIGLVGIAAATLTTLCWLPRALKVLRDKETRAIPLPATVAFMTGVTLWLADGLAIENYPLIGANAESLTLMVPILLMKLRYG